MSFMGAAEAEQVFGLNTAELLAHGMGAHSEKTDLEVLLRIPSGEGPPFFHVQDEDQSQLSFCVCVL